MGRRRATDTRLTAAERGKLALVLADFLNEYVGVLDAAIEIHQTSPRGVTDAVGQALMPYRQNIGINTILLTLRRFNELWPHLLKVLPRDSEARRLGKNILESYRAQKKIVDSYAARDAKQAGSRCPTPRAGICLRTYGRCKSGSIPIWGRWALRRDSRRTWPRCATSSWPSTRSKS